MTVPLPVPTVAGCDRNFRYSDATAYTAKRMWAWTLTIVGGLAMALVGAAVTLIVTYAILARRGVTEHEGRRGMLAFVYAITIGAPAGFWLGFKLAWWMVQRSSGR